MSIIEFKKELIAALIQALKDNKGGTEHIVIEVVTRKVDELIFGRKE